jgi:Heparinase II/III-like protein/Heparinase II/III N-terminus
VRLNRLFEMDAAEIAYRGREHAARWADRLALGRRSSPDLGAVLRDHLPSVGQQRETPGAVWDAARARFFAGPADSRAAEWLTEHMPGHGRAIVAAANAICGHRFDLLGYEGLSFGDPIDWHGEPVAGRRAPRVHWSRIDPLNAAVVGDSKVVWELNRHQWLITLAQAYWLTDDVRYAREAADLVDAWIRANPYGIGINWVSSLEVAIRFLSWCWGFLVLRESAVFSADELADALAVIWLHLSHIERHLSYYFSPNTHLTGEALALWHAGTVLPGFAEAGRWRETGRRILVEQSRRQIHSDGTHFERATAYQRYTVEIYLHLMLIADRNGESLPMDVRDRVERMLEGLLVLSHPDGTIPNLGDADGGWLLPLARRAPDDCRGLFAVAAAVFGRSDFAWAAGGLAPEVLWLLGVEGAARFAAIRPAPPAAPASRLLPSGGHAVMRSGWRRDAHQLRLDVASLGSPVSSAHAHAGLLAIECCAFGEPYLVDPGTFCYTGEAAWRRYFRSSVAHSTVVVDGRSQVEPAGAFGWRARPAVTLRAWRSTEDVDFVDAVHDGYTRLPDPVTHRRRVLFVKPAYWIVVDDLTGAGSHRVDLRFQFGLRSVTVGPGLWAAAIGRRRCGLWVAPFAAVALTARLRQGMLDPIEGWLSPDYGRRRPAPAVVYSTTTRLPLRIITLVLPVDEVHPVPPAVRVLRDWTGRLAGLALVDLGDTVQVDDLTVEARRGTGGTAPQAQGTADADAR